jgi:two-component system, NarL family, response regulator LiaR
MALRVLIAEDEVEMRTLILFLIRQDPAIHLVGEAEDGDDTIVQTRQHHPDLVLMDVMMPLVDGLEATRVIKRELPATKVLVLTNLTDERTRREAFDSGADAFIDKRDIATRLVRAIWNTARAA